MKYPLSEVFDRLTIETRKSHYGADNRALREQYVKAIRERFEFFATNIMVALVELTVANSDVANLEWAIRENKELSPAEVGLRALAIRDINARRIAAKEQLAKYLGEQVDPKRYDNKQQFTSILQPNESVIVRALQTLGPAMIDFGKKRKRREKTSRTRQKRRS